MCPSLVQNSRHTTSLKIREYLTAFIDLIIMGYILTISEGNLIS